MDYSAPNLTVYKSNAVAPGQAIVVGDKVFLNPADAHTLRKQVHEMSNSKVDATFHHPKPSRRELKRAARRKQSRQTPLAARIGAVVLMLAVVVGIAYGCTSAAGNGRAYDECIQKIAQEQGHEQAKLAQAQGECR